MAAVSALVAILRDGPFGPPYRMREETSVSPAPYSTLASAALMIGDHLASSAL